MTESRKNRFGITSLEDIPIGLSPRRRGSGPMSSAVRETAESVAEATEARVEQRKRNAADARAWRAAVDEGLMLARIPLDEIATTDLPRDRLDLEGVKAADEMDELKASIRVHGQKEPIELYRDDTGQLQLKKGWRRLTALRALQGETGDARFATALARIDGGVNDRLRHYVDMVEENILRQDLTYGEMADLALKAAADPAIEGGDPEAMVNRLYGALHKMKRSHIRSFVTVMASLGEDLRFPKALPRDLGLDLARAIRERPGDVGALRRDLVVAADVAEQTALLKRFVAGPGRVSPAAPKQDRQIRTFDVGAARITARKGELRIREATDFTDIPQERLEAAVAAFHKVLREG